MHGFDGNSWQYQGHESRRQGCLAGAVNTYPSSNLSPASSPPGLAATRTDPPVPRQKNTHTYIHIYIATYVGGLYLSSLLREVTVQCDNASLLPCPALPLGREKSRPRWREWLSVIPVTSSISSTALSAAPSAGRLR